MRTTGAQFPLCCVRIFYEQYLLTPYTIHLFILCFWCTLNDDDLTRRVYMCVHDCVYMYVRSHMCHASTTVTWITGTLLDVAQSPRSTDGRHTATPPTIGSTNSPLMWMREPAACGPMCIPSAYTSSVPPTHTALMSKPACVNEAKNVNNTKKHDCNRLIYLQCFTYILLYTFLKRLLF